MKSILVIVGLLIAGINVYAQQNYDASLISKDLLTYASAVIRNQEINVEVKDLDNVIYHQKTAITILNKNGDNLAHIAVIYDKSNVIKYIKGVVYDEFGKQIRKFSESDFADQAAIHNFSLYEDTRVKHYTPPVNQYPYTIVYEYEQHSKQSLRLSDWLPNSSSIAAVENSTYTFTCKPDFNIRYKEFNVVEKVAIATNSTGLKTYTWHASNIKALRPEPFSPNNENYLTRVKIAPDNFEYEHIKGSFTNWQELGKWEYDKLLLNRQNLPQATIDHIKEITANITAPKLKAKRIYEYMQSKTHYISVQIGIGGYQPFTADEVDKLGYSDCKGLVNYTQAMLKAAGIDSWYCVVNSGDRKISMESDFASMNQGDHVILCLPFKNDTTWLECTNQTHPFGYLGAFTDDRVVLACTPQGGKLMHTCRYTANDNIQARKANFVLAADGKLSGSMTTTFKGIQYSTRDNLINASFTEQTKVLQRDYPINNLDIVDVAIKQEKWPQPVTTENIKLNVNYFGNEDNGQIRFPLNPVDRQSAPLNDVRNRTYDVYINNGFTDEDELIYTLPAGYHLARETYNVTHSKPFGKYSASFTVKDGQLIYKRKLQVLDGTYSKEMYPEVVDFFQRVNTSDRLLVTLVKNN
ncbi:MAG TPA: DUF3857 domain-containing transglutaminase family protein [Mucilaginibacter sp.]